MAQLLNSSPAFIPSRDAEYAEIEAWYRQTLADTPPPADLEWEPIRIGPTWQWDDDGWILPDASLGWGFLAWCGYWLRGKGRKPWTFTMEQARFLLWYYAVETASLENIGGDFLSHSAMFQRLKGHGKDPLASTVAAGSLHAPIVFDHWDGDRAIGRDEPDAWTQIIAVSQDQTKNTMKLFPSLISPEAQKHYGIQIGKLNVWSDGDRRQIEAITASVLAVEGGRPKQIIRAETQNWTKANGGHDMAGALEGNAAKAETGAPARILDIFNAFRPGRDSVAERAREAWESTQGENAIQDYGVLLDSLEAPPNAPLTAEAAPSVVRSIAGDSVWLDTRPKGRIVASIMNPENSPSESRRKWYNQITGTEDAWADPRWVDKCNANLGKTAEDHMKIADGETIVMFGDGSKSDDSTGLVICRLSDGFFETFHYQLPEKGVLVDRNLVDASVDEAFDRFKIVAFFFDPSHAKANDSIEDDRFWWPLVDKWHEKYNKRLKLWAVASGPKKHSIAFDMLKPGPQQQFQPAVSQLREELEAGTALHNGGAEMRRHMKNARKREGRYGLSIGKEHRSSARKVDLAVCAVGARMLWRLVRLSKKAGTPGKGRVILLD